MPMKIMECQRARHQTIECNSKTTSVLLKWSYALKTFFWSYAICSLEKKLDKIRQFFETLRTLEIWNEPGKRNLSYIKPVYSWKKRLFQKSFQEYIWVKQISQNHLYLLKGLFNFSKKKVDDLCGPGCSYYQKGVQSLVCYEYRWCFLRSSLRDMNPH